jgi:FecR protein
MLAATVLATALLAVSGAALADPSLLREVSGSVEQQRGAQQGGAWQLAAPGQVIDQGLRVGTGRAVVVSGAGQAMLGSDSSLRIFQQEPDFLSGRIYISGNLKFFSQTVHMAAEGKVRLDISGPTRRIAVIAGETRLALGTQQIKLGAGQQYDFKANKVTPFSEHDPWYDSRFTGQGEARIEAINGPVQLQIGPGPARPAVTSEALLPGQQLLTGEGAWAEVGFTGGGFLRLQARSALSVLSIETVADASGKPQREVRLKLLRGSAWNVVTKNQGGYQLTTPTITTAVRGTVFRVDEDGLVKVFDGQVGLPSQGDALLATGKQRDQGGALQVLVPDASDAANQALDRLRALPTRLSLSLSPSLQNLRLRALSQPEATLNLELKGPGGAQRLALSGNAQGEFTLAKPATLPEGRYTLSLSAARVAGTRTLSRPLTIDRSAPEAQLTAQARQLGSTVLLRGQLQDALSGSLTLRAEIDGVVHRRRLRLVPGAAINAASLSWLLPLPRQDRQLRIEIADEAGNVRAVDLPLNTGAGQTGPVGYAAR